MTSNTLRSLLLGTALIASITTSAHAFPNIVKVQDNAHSLTTLVSDKKENDAQAFVQSMVDNGLAFLSDESLDKADKAQKFKTLLNESFDLDAISKFAVGRYWRNMSEEQQEEYTSLFKTMLVDVYSKRFDEYQGQSVKITGSEPLNEKDTIVKSKIISPKSNNDVPVEWRVRKKGNQYKVIDVLVAGVSMSVTQRSDFSSVIQRGGGDVSVLINHLKK